MTWPDLRAPPFRGEKDTNWEGGWRVPFVIRWLFVIVSSRVIHDICSLQDSIPTFAAAAGEPDLVEKVKKDIHSATEVTRFTSTVSTSALPFCE